MFANIHLTEHSFANAKQVCAASLVEKICFRLYSTMPKKTMKSSSHCGAWPAPKRGKARAVAKRPSQKVISKFAKIPYVRHGTPTTVSRPSRERWGRSIQQFASMKYPSLVRLLRRDQIIPEWSNRPCPHCGAGKLSKLTFYPYRKVWAHRCSAKFCQKYVQPHEFHPIFVQGAGASKTSLQTQASILLCATAAVPQHCLSKIMDVDDKIVSRIYNNLDIARARFVLAHEKRIQYGGSARWEDVEADEVDLGKGLVENYDKPKLNTKWEQWLGVVQRGSPGSLRLIRLDPPLTKPRSPGPGPIRKRDWKPVAKQYLEGRRIVLHTDGARAYKLKLDQVQHCNVVHKKKQVKVNGKAA